MVTAALSWREDRETVPGQVQIFFSFVVDVEAGPLELFSETMLSWFSADVVE